MHPCNGLGKDVSSKNLVCISFFSILLLLASTLQLYFLENSQPLPCAAASYEPAYWALDFSLCRNAGKHDRKDSELPAVVGDRGTYLFPLCVAGNVPDLLTRYENCNSLESHGNFGSGCGFLQRC